MSQSILFFYSLFLGLRLLLRLRREARDGRLSQPSSEKMVPSHKHLLRVSHQETFFCFHSLVGVKTLFGFLLPAAARHFCLIGSHRRAFIV